jgi:membrane AbrB-like protein
MCSQGLPCDHDVAVSFLIVIALALAGSYAGFRTNLPGGPIVGAMAPVVAFQLLSPRPATEGFPGWLTVGLFALLGAQIGLSVTRSSLAPLKDQWWLIVILAAGVYVAAFLIVVVIARLARIDVASALLAGSPGGFAGIAGISLTAKVNVGQVIAVHTVRLLLIYLTLPFILARVTTAGR